MGLKTINMDEKISWNCPAQIAFTQKNPKQSIYNE